MVDSVELLGGGDDPGLGWHGRFLHPLAGVEEDHLIVEGGREDRGQDGRSRRDADWGHPRVFERGDPGSDVFGQDVDHPHPTELGYQVLGDGVGVALAGGELDLVVG